MAHIVCITSGLRGLLSASTDLLVRLQQDGHTITYACGQHVGDEFRARDIPYVQLPAVNFSPAAEPTVEKVGTGRLRRKFKEWKSASSRRSAGVLALNLAPYKKFLTDERPDLVLLDTEMYEHIFCTWKLGLNLALISPFFNTRQAANVPPLQSDIVPGKGIKGSALAIHIAWLNIQLRNKLRRLKTSLRYAYTERRAVLLEYARQSNYPISQLNQDNWVTLFDDCNLPLLRLCVKELDFIQKVKLGTYYVGPMISQHRAMPQCSQQTIEKLQTRLQECRVAKQVILYCGLSTMQMDEETWLRELLKAVGDESKWSLLIACPDARLRERIPTTRNVHIFGFVPQLTVLGAADLCISNGGVNTLNECVFKKVPMLIYAPNIADKPGCAARAESFNIGIRGNRNASAEEIHSDILRALSDNSLLHGLDQAHQDLTRYEDERILQKTIHHLLAHPVRLRT